MQRSNIAQIIIDRSTFNDLVAINKSYVDRHRRFKAKIRELSNATPISFSYIGPFGAILPHRFSGAVRDTISCLNQLARNNQKFKFVIDKSIIEEHKNALAAGIILGEIDYSHLIQRTQSEYENSDNLTKAKDNLSSRRRLSRQIPTPSRFFHPPRKGTKLTRIMEEGENKSSISI